MKLDKDLQKKYDDFVEKTNNGKKCPFCGFPLLNVSAYSCCNYDCHNMNSFTVVGIYSEQWARNEKTSWIKNILLKIKNFIIR
jgi:hypothetical protein